MCFRYFDYKRFEDIDRLTIPQISLMQKALNYKELDKQNDLHTLAFLTNAAGAVKHVGNKSVPVYPTYKSFFDYEKELYKLEHSKEIEAKNKRLKELAEKRKKGGYKDD